MNVLPKTGGFLDQDPVHVMILNTVMAAQNERAELEREQRRQMQMPGR